MAYSRALLTPGLIRLLLLIALQIWAALPVTATAGRDTDISAEWHKSGRDVLRGFRNMYQPEVIHEPGADYPFKMWFFGWASTDCNASHSGCDAIFLARGKTLDKWEVYAGEGKWDAAMDPSAWAPVMTAGSVFFDSWHNGDPSVVKKDGLYYMALSATGHNRDRIPVGQPGDTDGDISCVMGATSPDGIHWTKTIRPILIYRPDIGAKDGAVHGGLYHRPSLLFDQGKWRCWFDYWTGRSLAMGYAECPEGSFSDPAAWRVIRAGSNPVLDNFPNPDVVKVGSTYHAFADSMGYDKHPWTGRRICEAVSSNGIDWRVRGFVLPEKDTPATHVPQALVIDECGKAELVIFYACQVGGEPYDYRYDRIRSMIRRGVSSRSSR
jgi:hypothetical protein